MYNSTQINKYYKIEAKAGEVYQAKATNGNRKLSKAIYNINLPPVITCNPKAPCFKECYGRKGHFLYSNVKGRMRENLLAYVQNPKAFFDDIASQTRACLFVRWFGNGDMPDMTFFEGMCAVARKNRDTKYLAFTKQYQIVNDYLSSGRKIPANLKIVYSTWKDWIPENPFNMPTTYVRFPEIGKEAERNTQVNQLIPKTAFKCPSDCSSCQRCWALKKGWSVEFHKH